MKPSEKAEFIKLKERVSALEEWVANRDEAVEEPEAVEPEPQKVVEEAPVQQEPEKKAPKRKAKPKKKA